MHLFFNLKKGVPLVRIRLEKKIKFHNTFGFMHHNIMVVDSNFNGFTCVAKNLNGGAAE